MEPVSAPRDVALICFTSGKRYGLVRYIDLYSSFLSAVLEYLHFFIPALYVYCRYTCIQPLCAISEGSPHAWSS
jgi:hypothetical protein